MAFVVHPIHKYASLKEMNPGQPFYLVDDGTQPALSGPTMLGLSKGPIPSLFYAMLNKCLALPLLESWAAYLGENGRERKLITLLDSGEGQGYTACQRQGRGRKRSLMECGKDSLQGIGLER